MCGSGASLQTQHLCALQLQGPVLDALATYMEPTLPALQGKDTILNIPLLGKRKRRQEGAAAPPRQTLLGSMFWALGTGVGMLYLAAILCLCAWPCIHFIVEFSQHSSMVSTAGTQPCVIRLCCDR